MLSHTTVSCKSAGRTAAHCCHVRGGRHWSLQSLPHQAPQQKGGGFNLQSRHDRARILVHSNSQPIVQSGDGAGTGDHGNYGKGDNPVDIVYNIHGRHVEVSPALRHHVVQRLSKALNPLKTAEVLEAEGGIGDVDVRLMNTSAEIKVHPVRQNKGTHDTFLRQGELQAVATGGKDVYDSFEQAVEQLEKKLTKWRKPAPKKVDYRHFGPAK